MTEEQFTKAMKTPPGGVAAQTALWLFLAVCATGIASVGKGHLKIPAIIAAIAMGLFSLYELAQCIREMIRLRKNADECIEELKSGKLLGKAAAQYGSDERYDLEIVRTDGRFNRYSKHSNALGKDFVYIMSEKKVLRYNEITEIFFRKNSYSTGTEASARYTNNVLVLKTAEGKEYELFSAEIETLSQRDVDKMNRIVETVRNANPGAAINTDDLSSEIEIK